MIALQVLPQSAQDQLRQSVPAHVDPRELAPQEAFELLWAAGYVSDSARAWETVKALAYAEICAQALANHTGG
jgi:hypothetical protein